jgi:hypothetical protein
MSSLKGINKIYESDHFYSSSNPAKGKIQTSSLPKTSHIQRGITEFYDNNTAMREDMTGQIGTGKRGGGSIERSESYLNSNPKRFDFHYGKSAPNNNNYTMQVNYDPKATGNALKPNGQSITDKNGGFGFSDIVNVVKKGKEFYDKAKPVIDTVKPIVETGIKIKNTVDEVKNKKKGGKKNIST